MLAVVGKSTSWVSLDARAGSDGIWAVEPSAEKGDQESAEVDATWCLRTLAGKTVLSRCAIQRLRLRVRLQQCNRV
jgi:hypothetical protein